MSVHFFSDTAATTSLVGTINNSVTSMTVASVSGFPALPYYLVIDRGTPSLEVVEVTAGTNPLTIVRGQSNTAAVSHNANAVVEHLAPAVFLASVSSTVEALAGLGASAGMIVQPSAGTFTKRTLTAGSSKVTVTNGTGQVGNPTVDVVPANFTGIPKAGVTGAPSGAVVGDTDTQTLTNKRVTPRANTVASSATPAINTDTTDIFTITALGVAITSMTSSLTGTPTDGQKLLIRFKDNGTARAIAWGASFESVGGTLPTTTVLSKRLYVGLVYDSVALKWSCVGTAQEA